MFDERIVNAICDYVDKKPVIPWQRLYEYRFLYKTRHYITYGGNPTGRYVYLYEEMRRGWYRWHMVFIYEEPIYLWLTESAMGFQRGDGEEYKVVMPDTFNDYELDELDMMFMDSGYMEQD